METVYKAQFPTNWTEMYNTLNALPLMLHQKGQFNAVEVIQRALSNSINLLLMKFIPKLKQSYEIYEFAHTARFQELFFMCNSGELPLIYNLYVDNFRKFRSLWGETAGFYMKFNWNRFI